MGRTCEHSLTACTTGGATDLLRGTKSDCDSGLSKEADGELSEGDVREDPTGMRDVLSSRDGCNLFSKIDLLLSIDSAHRSNASHATTVSGVYFCSSPLITCMPDT